MPTFALIKVVGIKQLKARLSEYVRLAKAGETVLVTERDEVVAELGAPPGTGRQPSRETLAATGEITRAGQPEGDWTWHSQALGLPTGSAQTLLHELRQERAWPAPPCNSTPPWCCARRSSKARRRRSGRREVPDRRLLQPVRLRQEQAGIEVRLRP